VWVIRTGKFLGQEAGNVRPGLLTPDVLPGWWNELKDSLGHINDRELGQLSVLDVLIKDLITANNILRLQGHK